MNKRGLIKYISVVIASFISLYFIIKTGYSGVDSIFNMMIIIDFILALAIFMLYNKNKIKKNKFIYDVILILLMLASVLWLVYYLYSRINCFFDIACSMEGTNLEPLYFVLPFLMLLFGFMDIFKKTNKVNDILTIIVSSLITLIHLRYYLEPNFIHNLISNPLYIQSGYYYIIQNYIYFMILYLIIFIHYIINKDNKI